MSDDDLERVSKAAASLERAEQATAAAREGLREAVLAAHRAGASLSAIARAAGVSRQWIAQLVRSGN